MVLRDYNGTGKWSRDSAVDRYAEYVRRYAVACPAVLTPMESTNEGVRRIYPIMSEIIKAIEVNDAAAIEIGVEFIDEDQKLPFGKILKSNTARALRRTTLTPYQEDRIHRRVLRMLIDGMVPREYPEYAKLLRRVGVGELWADADAKVDRSNP